MTVNAQQLPVAAVGGIILDGRGPYDGPSVHAVLCRKFTSATAANVRKYLQGAVPIHDGSLFPVPPSLCQDRVESARLGAFSLVRSHESVLRNFSPKSQLLCACQWSRPLSINRQGRGVACRYFLFYTNFGQYPVTRLYLIVESQGIEGFHTDVGRLVRASDLQGDGQDFSVSCEEVAEKTGGDVSKPTSGGDANAENLSCP